MASQDQDRIITRRYPAGFCPSCTRAPCICEWNEKSWIRWDRRIDSFMIGIGLGVVALFIAIVTGVLP